MSNNNSQFNFSDLNTEILLEHNKIRSNPSSYIPILEEHIKLFKDNILHRPNEIPLQTNEGPSAYEEAIKFLEDQVPVNELELDENLSLACQDHIKDIAPKGLVTHDGTDGSNVSDRIERYCEWEGTCAENIDLGSKTGVCVVLSLLVDDGVKSRGHRRNLFKPDVKRIGIYSGDHKEFETCIVIALAGDVREKGKPFFDIKNYKYTYPADLNAKPEKGKKKNVYQRDDEDAPDHTVSVKITKSMNLYNQKVRRVTKKFYKLEDGSEQIVEVEDSY